MCVWQNHGWIQSLRSQIQLFVVLHVSFIFRIPWWRLKSWDESVLLPSASESLHSICHLKSNIVGIIVTAYGSQRRAYWRKWNDGEQNGQTFVWQRVTSLKQELWMLSWPNALFCTLCSSSSLLHLSKYHYRPSICLGQKTRSNACFSLLPPT